MPKRKREKKQPRCKRMERIINTCNRTSYACHQSKVSIEKLSRPWFLAVTNEDRARSISRFLGFCHDTSHISRTRKYLRLIIKHTGCKKSAVDSMCFLIHSYPLMKMKNLSRHFAIMNGRHGFELVKVKRMLDETDRSVVVESIIDLMIQCSKDKTKSIFFVNTLVDYIHPRNF